MSSITATIRDLLRSYVFIDSDRESAQQTVRDICHDRIFDGRKPQGAGDGAWLDIVRIGDDPQYTTTRGLSSASVSMVEITSHAQDPHQCARLAAAVRIVLELVRIGGDVCIGACTVVDDGESRPESIPDASGGYDHQIDQLYAIRHARETARGLA